MAAGRLNYIVIYNNDSQVYGSGSKEVALTTPLPQGITIEEKHVFFITHKPDTGEIVVHELPQEEVLQAEIKEKKTKSEQKENND